jgi:hypothetical protein
MLLLIAAITPAAVEAGGVAPSPHSLPGYAYISPAPGTAQHLSQTNIIVRPGGSLRTTSFDPATTIAVTASRSGPHTGTVRISDDGETIIFKPDRGYLPGETVTCTIAPGLRVQGRSPLPRADFTFRVVGLEPEPAAGLLPGLESERPDVAVTTPYGSTRPLPRIAPALGVAPSPAAPRAGIAAGSAPPLSTRVEGSTAPGDLFLSDFRFGDSSYRSHLMIVRNDGSIVFERELAGQGFDFKVQPDGRLTYFDAVRGTHYALNESYAVVDSFRCGNGYPTDIHDLRLLENGHALLMSYDARHVDMSQVVVGGQTDAVVSGLIIQELDRAKDVVFQWRSWDHFRVTDTTHRSLTGPTLDYVHGNAVEREPDGDLLISSRHMDEITKIDRETGALIWRLGGTNNEFRFVNDPDGFSHQHAVRRLPNGHIILFDNGNFHTPQYSRAVEYALDERAKIATLVWEYRHTPDLYGGALGYVQRLENGNTLVSWGASPTTVTEVSPDGRTVFEGQLPPPLFSYRVTRHEWPAARTARVTLEPRVLGAASRGRWVTATIDPVGFNPEDVDVTQIRLADDLAPDPRWAERGDGDLDGSDDLRVRFERDALLTKLHPGPTEVEVGGRLVTGGRFRARASVRVTGSTAGAPSPPRVVSAPGTLPAQLRFSGGAPTYFLEAFDVRGRLVRRWRAAPDEAGNVTWDGRGRTGAPAAAGIYFVREAGNSAARAARVVIAR